MAVQLKIQDLVAAVDASIGVEASAVTFIQGFGDTVKKAVADALAADDAADEGTTIAANEAIDGAIAKAVASRTALAAAMVSNPTPPVA